MGNDLEIEIRAGSTPGTYEVEVDSPAGTATGTMQLDAASILNRRRELAASVLASAVTQRAAYSTLEAPVREVGHALFEALFADHVYGRYTASLQEAGRKGEPLRVVLRLRVDELAGIPWETLFDPEAGEYLCQREPVVRYVDSAQPSAPLAATGPLRILGIVAAPKDLAALDTAEERRRLDDSLGELQEQGLVEMVWVDGGSWSALQQQLMAGPWHVLHVIGHGGVRAQGGVLALEDEKTGNASMVSAARFARLLHACRPVPRLVVLNSCSSGESAADDLLSSTAASLVHSGITATVAMQFAVTDPAALAFSRGFYQAMAHNIAVDEAVRLGRIAIDGTGEQTLEWVTPVVYLRTDDTRLFELTAADGVASTATSEEGEAIPEEAAKYGLYVQALAAARRGKYDEAVALFDSVSTLDPGYRDTAARRDAARLAQRQGADRERVITSLQDELRVHAGVEDWEAVQAVSDELRKLDPTAADPDGLATRARDLLGVEQEADVQRTRTLTGVGDVESTTDGPGTDEPGTDDRATDEGGGGGADSDDTGERERDPGRRRWRFSLKLTLAITVPLAAIAFAAGIYLNQDDPPPEATATADNKTIDEPAAGSADTAGNCWDGSTAADAQSCPQPEGLKGMQSVFPSLGDNCEKKQPMVEGKIEIFECVFPDYTIRYSRWQQGFDRYSYFNRTNPNAEHPQWIIEGDSVGRAWVGLDDRPDVERKFRWLASYRSAPYEVLVQGVDQEGRDAGWQSIEAKHPRDIGLN